MHSVLRLGVAIGLLGLIPFSASAQPEAECGFELEGDAPEPPGGTIFLTYQPPTGDIAQPATMNADGTGLQLMKSFAIAVKDALPDQSVFSPSVSPDGSQIAFYARPNRWEGDYPPDGSFQAYVASADGTKLRRITSPPDDHILPRFSPDGQRISVVAARGGRGSNLRNIQVLGADGTLLLAAPRPTGVNTAQWAMDGNRILFDTAGSGGVGVGLLDPTTGRVELLVRGDGRIPALSPDGELLAYGAGLRGEAASILVIRSGCVLNPAIPGFWNGAVWSPDSQWLLVGTTAGVFLVGWPNGRMVQVTGERGLYLSGWYQ